MNLPTVLWWLGMAVLVVGIAMLAPVLVAVFSDESRALPAFVISVIICTFLGAALVVASAVRTEKSHAKSGIREVVLLLLLWWLAVPILAGLPFLFTGLNLIDAWYESVSAMTTTGAWLSWENATSSASGMIWRAELQWLGGLVSMSAAAAVFVRPEFIGIASISTPFSRGEEESYLLAFRSAMINFAPLYAAITVIIAILFLLFSTPLTDALVMALSLPASGGFLPAGVDFNNYSAPVQMISFSAMVLSAVSFISVVNTVRFSGQKIRVKEDIETPALLFCILLVGFIFLLTSDNPQLSALPNQVLNAASILSTNGFLFPEFPALVPVLVTTVIGGAAVSTAGGLKLIRWIVTFRRAGQEVWKLIHPSGVSGRDRAANELAVWIHYISFTIILALLVLVISVFGHPLELSVTAAAAAISNAGPTIAIAAENSDYLVFEPSLRVVLALGMIVGRLEMVVALALFSSYFWRS